MKVLNLKTKIPLFQNTDLSLRYFSAESGFSIKPVTLYPVESAFPHLI